MAGVRSAVIEVWRIIVGVLSNYVVSEIVWKCFSESGDAHVSCDARVGSDVMYEKIYYPRLLVGGLQLLPFTFRDDFAE